MTIKQQVGKIKENWLMIVLVLVIFFVFSGIGNIGSYGLNSLSKSVGYNDYAVSESLAYDRGYYPSSGGDFAPEVEDRKITKTTSMSTEVDRGDFSSAVIKLKNIVSSSDSFILNENSNKYGTGRRAYMQGYYSLKVEVEKYDSVISQLKEIGEVQSFNENSQDVTGRYTDLNADLNAEKSRLARYKEMYSEAVNVNDKLEINDRIFNQERTISYLEDAIANIDKRVEYSTVSVTITEERSEWIDITVVKFSELIRSVVGSFNNLVRLIFVLIPWAIFALIVGLIWKRVRK